MLTEKQEKELIEEARRKFSARLGMARENRFTDQDRAGKRLSMGGMTEIFRRRSQLAGVPVHRPHSYRRAFALLAKRGGADILSIQQLLGHTDLRVTRLYVDAQEEDLHEEHRKGGPVDRWL